MADYLRAECYKMTHRSYLWGALLITAALETVMVLLWAWLNGDVVHLTSSGGLAMLFYLLPMGFYAAAISGDIVFSDQYKHNTLKNEVAFGLPRSRIYLGKLLAGCLLSLAACVAILGWYGILCVILLPGDGAVGAAMAQVGFALLCALPLWLGAQAMFTLCYFGFRGSTAGAIVGVCVIALLGQLLTFLSLMVELPSPALAEALTQVQKLLLTTPLDGLTEHIGEGARLAWAWGVGAGWYAATTALGLCIFRKREIS